MVREPSKSISDWGAVISKVVTTSLFLWHPQKGCHGIAYVLLDVGYLFLISVLEARWCFNLRSLIVVGGAYPYRPPFPAILQVPPLAPPPPASTFPPPRSAWRTFYGRETFRDWYWKCCERDISVCLLCVVCRVSRVWWLLRGYLTGDYFRLSDSRVVGIFILDSMLWAWSFI